MWEGEAKIDLLNTFAPWALETAVADCAVDGVCVACEPAVAGPSKMYPISDMRTARKTSHFVAAVSVGDILLEPGYQCGSELERFYYDRGVVVLGTVCDGDCGIDVVCQMIGAPQTPEQRRLVRQGIADWLLLRLREPWVHDLMVALQELEAADVARFRSCGYAGCNLQA